jgi:hypothetical protein
MRVIKRINKLIKELVFDYDKYIYLLNLEQIIEKKNRKV